MQLIRVFFFNLIDTKLNIEMGFYEIVQQRVFWTVLIKENFALYIIKKLTKWGRVKLRIDNTCVFRSCRNCPT